MIKKDGDVESYTEASSPTPPGQESVTPTDMIDDAVEEIIDDIQEAFEGGPDDRENREDEKS